MFPGGNNPLPTDSLEIAMKKFLDAMVNGGSPAATIFPGGLQPHQTDSLEITAKKLLEAYLLSL